MKVVLAVHQFLPEYSAGTEVLTFETAQELKQRGHEVIVWTGSPHNNSKNIIDEYVYQGILVKRYFFNPKTAASSGNLMEVTFINEQFGRIFEDFLIDYKPDLIHFFHLNRLSSTCIHAGSKHKVSMVFTATDFWYVCPTNQLRLPNNSLCNGPDNSSINCVKHMVLLSQPKIISTFIKLMPDRTIAFLIKCMSYKWWPEKKISSMIQSLISRKDILKDAFDLLDKVIVPTSIMFDTYVRYGYNLNKIIKQSYGINMENQAIDFVKKNSAALRIGFIGTLSEHKGTHVLLEAIKYLNKDAKIEVKIYGSVSDFPTYSSKLKEIAQNDDRIRFFGTFPNREINQIFSGIDVLVVPSLWLENTPLVIYSAQATKTPVIASDLPGLSEVINHEYNGLLFEKGNVQHLTAVIERLLLEQNLLKSLAANSKEPKSINNYVDELELIYQGVLARGV